MSGVEPLLRDGATDFERQLLSAVRGERPSARQRARMLRGDTGTSADRSRGTGVVVSSGIHPV